MLDVTKLCSAANILEGRYAIQKDLDKLEKWAHANIMVFSKVQCKVLQVSWGNFNHKYRLHQRD